MKLFKKNENKKTTKLPMTKKVMHGGWQTSGTVSPTVIVAPITSRIHTKAKLPTHTLINDFEGLDKNSIILLEQVRTIDKQRLKQYLGMIPDNIVARVDKALAISVALEKTKATDV